MASIDKPDQWSPVSREHFKFAQIDLQSSTEVMFNYIYIMFRLGCAHARSGCASKRRRIESHGNLISSSDQSTLKKNESGLVTRTICNARYLFEPSFTSIFSAHYSHLPSAAASHQVRCCKPVYFSEQVVEDLNARLKCFFLSL